MKKIVNFIFETSALKRIPRSGWQVLGVTSESVAEHSWHAAIIGMVLAYLSKADVNKVVKILLIHDIAEVRTGDFNKLQNFYSKKDELKAVLDQSKGLPFEKEYRILTKEHRERKTLEAKIAHDADILSLLVRLKEFMDQGNKQAENWFFANKERLRTKEGIKLGNALAQTDSQEWWGDIKKEIHKGYKIHMD